MATTKIYDEIHEFTSQHDMASYIADVVLNDCNTLDSNIEFAIDYARTHRDEFLHDHPDVMSSEVDEVIEFLEHLLTIPEDDRECFTDEDEE